MSSTYVYSQQIQTHPSYMNLCSCIVSDSETFHLQVILSGKGSFMKQQSHTDLIKCVNKFT